MNVCSSFIRHRTKEVVGYLKKAALSPSDAQLAEIISQGDRAAPPVDVAILFGKTYQVNPEAYHALFEAIKIRGWNNFGDREIRVYDTLNTVFRDSGN